MMAQLVAGDLQSSFFGVMFHPILNPGDIQRLAFKAPLADQKKPFGP
jgi:hypothetical protein